VDLWTDAQSELAATGPTGAMMVRDPAARVAAAIMELIVMARGDVLRQRIEDLLREEFSDERRWRCSIAVSSVVSAAVRSAIT
jgi:hypothetical protein